MRQIFITDRVWAVRACLWCVVQTAAGCLGGALLLTSLAGSGDVIMLSLVGSGDRCVNSANACGLASLCDRQDPLTGPRQTGPRQTSLKSTQPVTWRVSHLDGETAGIELN